MKKLISNDIEFERFKNWLQKRYLKKPEDLKMDANFFDRMLRVNIQSIKELQQKIESTTDPVSKSRLLFALNRVKNDIQNLKRFEKYIREYSEAEAARKQFEELFAQSQYEKQLEKLSFDLSNMFDYQIDNKIKDLRLSINSTLDAIDTLNKFATIDEVVYSTDRLYTLALSYILCLEEKLRRSL